MEVPLFSLDYYDKIHARTSGVIACIPKTHLDWAPSPGKFSFGDLVRHIAAMERLMFVENAMMRPSKYQGCSSDLAQGYEETMRFYHEMHRQSRDVLCELTEPDLSRRCLTPAGALLPVWKWLRAMMEHEIHHRGQLYVYLALNGVAAPPIFGLTSEQVIHLSNSEIK